MFSLFQWKIRAAISTIIHELALMLSKEQTEEDLLPVFKSIMEDLEPVRIGTLSHMASFLGVSICFISAAQHVSLTKTHGIHY